ncbi:MAG: DUF6714 family protein, partial [Acidimicrobiia bacterium]
MDKQQLIELIRGAFAATTYPGDGFLLGSREGDDAFEAVQPFRGVTDWSSVEPAVLDENYDALSFLSEGGFRYFLPAYLIADINDQLETADPVFHLTGGFHDAVVRISHLDEPFEKRIGKTAFVNPRRYGAIRFEDYARYRLSVFTREEAAGIVAYLEYRRNLPDSIDREAIDAALDDFWRGRVESGPDA